MSAYTDKYAIAIQADHVLRKQVHVALYEKALEIIAESPATENHEQRVAWANRVFSPGGAARWAEFVMLRVLNNPTIAGAPTTAGDVLVLSVIANIVPLVMKIAV